MTNTCSLNGEALSKGGHTFSIYGATSSFIRLCPFLPLSLVSAKSRVKSLALWLLNVPLCSPASCCLCQSAFFLSFLFFFGCYESSGKETICDIFELDSKQRAKSHHKAP